MKIMSYKAGRWDEYQPDIVSEQPVSLTVNNESWLTFMCTPFHLEALAVGFLYNEGIIQAVEEVASVTICPTKENIDIWLHHSVAKPDAWRRTSGCSGGFTGVTETHQKSNPKIAEFSAVLTANVIGSLLNQLYEVQELYKQTGGVHTSALSDGEKILLSAEDIGRHNTLDKIAGRCLLEHIDASRRIILTTGRISSEMIQKANRIGASIVISRTSPTSLSVKMADEMGITLIGYARKEQFIVYSHPERILAAPVEEKVLSEEK